MDAPEQGGRLIGHDMAERALLDAYRSGRIHHAWLLDGPGGIGKATLAYRFARFVLANPDPTSPAVTAAEDLSIADDHPAGRQVVARAHPNLVVLDRPDSDDGKRKMTVIPIDSVRRVARFLGSTAAGGNWRIVIVDSADDLNRSSANALLKMLEEPPNRALFLLVSHVAGRLLPTIRSRCRRLAMQGLGSADLERALDAAGIEGPAEDRARAIALAHGSVGRALELASDEGAEIARATLSALDDLPRGDPVARQTLAERLGRRGADEPYRLATSLILDWIAGQGREMARSGAGPALLAPWSEVWEKVSRALAEAEIYNLDRTQTLLTAFRTVSAAAVHDAAA